MSKSKSKTFKKGTDMNDVSKWISGHVRCNPRHSLAGLDIETDSKYLITITKYPEKEEKV